MADGVRVLLDIDSAFAEEQARDREVADTAEIDNVGYAYLNGGKKSRQALSVYNRIQKKAFDTVPVSLVSADA